MVVLTMNLTITEDAFFVPGLQGLITNVALLLGISEDRITIAGVGDFSTAVTKGERNMTVARELKQAKLADDIINPSQNIDLIILDSPNRIISEDDNVNATQEEIVYFSSAKELNDFADKVMHTNQTQLASNTSLNINNTLKWARV